MLRAPRAVPVRVLNVGLVVVVVVLAVGAPVAAAAQTVDPAPTTRVPPARITTTVRRRAAPTSVAPTTAAVTPPPVTAAAVTVAPSTVPLAPTSTPADVVPIEAVSGASRVADLTRVAGFGGLAILILAGLSILTAVVVMARRRRAGDDVALPLATRSDVRGVDGRRLDPVPSTTVGTGVDIFLDLARPGDTTTAPPRADGRPGRLWFPRPAAADTVVDLTAVGRPAGAPPPGTAPVADPQFRLSAPLFPDRPGPGGNGSTLVPDPLFGPPAAATAPPPEQRFEVAPGVLCWEPDRSDDLRR